MKDAISAHGGRLINQELSGKEAENIDTGSMPTIHLSAREISDLEMIAIGAFSPLRGFMGRDDYESVISNMRLNNGLPWTIPIKLAVSKENAAELKLDQDIALLDKDKHAVAILELREKYKYDKAKEALE
ncbi:MAG TPA: sulfate adenylyltransferase, partial [Actinobacteria bacterium]|nr:sulfate adenylyltransferase [Actinomycetes bacterium]HEX21746.1 sulfate adenylyltransferase [Actinomycetota bacterium]